MARRARAYLERHNRRIWLYYPKVRCSAWFLKLFLKYWGYSRSQVFFTTYLVSNVSRLFAKDCRSLWLSGGGPPVSIPLARKVSIKSLIFRRPLILSAEYSSPRGLRACPAFSITSDAKGISAVITRSPALSLLTISWSATSAPEATCKTSMPCDLGTRRG